MKLLLLLLLSTLQAFAQNYNDRFTHMMDTSKEPDSPKAITASQLVDKNCNESMTMKDIETAEGDSFRTYTCDKGMMVYIDRETTQINFRIFSRQSSKKLVELLMISKSREVSSLTKKVQLRYKNSAEARTEQAKIDKRNQEIRDKKARIQAEKDQIIKSLLE